MRWWSARALLGSVASSPAAAAETLRTRAATADARNEAEVDEIGQRTVLDLMDDEGLEGIDITPGSDIEEEAEGPGGSGERHEQRRLREMAPEADALRGAPATKLQQGVAV